MVEQTTAKASQYPRAVYCIIALLLINSLLLAGIFGSLAFMALSMNHVLAGVQAGQVSRIVANVDDFSSSIRPIASTLKNLTQIDIQILPESLAALAISIGETDLGPIASNVTSFASSGLQALLALDIPTDDPWLANGFAYLSTGLAIVEASTGRFATWQPPPHSAAAGGWGPSGKLDPISQILCGESCVQWLIDRSHVAPQTMDSPPATPHPPTSAETLTAVLYPPCHTSLVPREWAEADRTTLRALGKTCTSVHGSLVAADLPGITHNKFKYATDPRTGAYAVVQDQAACYDPTSKKMGPTCNPIPAGTWGQAMGAMESVCTAISKIV